MYTAPLNIEPHIYENRKHCVVKGKFEDFEFVGALLGYATSEQEFHSHDTTTHPYTPQGTRCSACRWLEVSLYRIFDEDEEDLGRYLVARTGASIIPGEEYRYNASFTNSAFEVYELLVVRRLNTVTLPGPSARVLAQAANVDRDIENAYINRPVV